MIRALLLMLLLAGRAAAVECGNLEFEGYSFTTCTVDPAREDLRLFHEGRDGVLLGRFSAVEAEAGRALLFAMNAGMYHEDRSPVGLYIEGGAEKMRLIPGAGPGNFGMVPNGVLCINATSAQVIETERFIARAPTCRDASQSGPMLVTEGALHPRFIAGGDSRHLRNGVGARADGRLVFAISNEPVNFHTFGRLFRDALETPNALFLDGKVSRLHAPSLNRSDFGFTPMGPIVGVLGR